MNIHLKFPKRLLISLLLIGLSVVMQSLSLIPIMKDFADNCQDRFKYLDLYLIFSIFSSILLLIGVAFLLAEIIRIIKKRNIGIVALSALPAITPLSMQFGLFAASVLCGLMAICATVSFIKIAIYLFRNYRNIRVGAVKILPSICNVIFTVMSVWSLSYTMGEIKNSLRMEAASLQKICAENSECIKHPAGYKELPYRTVGGSFKREEFIDYLIFKVPYSIFYRTDGKNFVLRVPYGIEEAIIVNAGVERNVKDGYVDLGGI